MKKTFLIIGGVVIGIASTAFVMYKLLAPPKFIVKSIDYNKKTITFKFGKKEYVFKGSKGKEGLEVPYGKYSLSMKEDYASDNKTFQGISVKITHSGKLSDTPYMEIDNKKWVS